MYVHVCAFNIKNDRIMVTSMYLCLSDSEIEKGLCLRSMYTYLILCVGMFEVVLCVDNAESTASRKYVVIYIGNIQLIHNTFTLQLL